MACFRTWQRDSLQLSSTDNLVNLESNILTINWFYFLASLNKFYHQCFSLAWWLCAHAGRCTCVPESHWSFEETGENIYTKGEWTLYGVWQIKNITQWKLDLSLCKGNLHTGLFHLIFYHMKYFVSTASKGASPISNLRDCTWCPRYWQLLTW